MSWRERLVYVRCEVCGYRGWTVGFHGRCPCPHTIEPEVPEGQEVLAVDDA